MEGNSLQVDTKYFGCIEYDPSDLLCFPDGLFGFEDEKSFLLLPFQGSAGMMLCLQSVHTPSLAFVVMNPFSLQPDYAPELSPDELAAMEVSCSQDLCFYVLCVVKNPVSSSTVNLRCPIVVNEDTRQALQVILDTQIYHMRHPLSEFGREGGHSSPC